ncbi:putative quinol monooxygenase [Variovorax sp. LjRoot84]|uniref:putative quinol monooxygenase n=1 Tax=Variovorax sp. LjRoot84 TaxID=3342340 RepID=UPI003ED16EC4
MNTRQLLMLVASAATLCLCLSAVAQEAQAPVVRWADLEIDPAQLERFKAAASENAEATRRLEPGVLAFHAAAEKGNRTRIRVFEVYKDAGAYRAHLQTPHFQRFRATTEKMMTARKLYDTVPILLGSKPQLPATALVRIAELEIDPAQLEAYRAAVTEEIEASIRVEPGVLAIYSVALKDNLSHLRFFEIYADENAYRQHIESPHFKKYVDLTKSMITARRLFEAEPIAASAKAR